MSHDDNQDPHASGAAPVVSPIIGSMLAFALIITLGLLTDEIYQIEEDLETHLTAAADGAITIPAALAAQGQSAYVPIDSGLETGTGRIGSVETVLSLRNTDPAHELRIDSVRGFTSAGDQMMELIETPLTLKAMATERLTISLDDGEDKPRIASALVKWSSTETLNPPIFEATLIGRRGIISNSRGKAVERH